MKDNKELSKIRIDTELYNNIMKLLEQLNDNEIGVEIDFPQFRKMAYRHFYNTLKVEGLEIKWDLKSH